MDIANLKEQIRDKLNHSYIKQIVGQPFIDDDKLMILSALMDCQSSLSEIEKERCIITAMLIQVALDTHEQVPITFQPNMSNDEKAVIQLRVLAGDYYSGLYYLLLSEIEQYDLIHTLAAAIKEINEYKMKLYYLDENLIEESMDLIRKIDISLILYVADYVKDPSLNDISSEWLIINRLIREKDNLNNKVESTFLRKFLNSNHISFINRVDSVIHEKCLTVKNRLADLPEHHKLLKEHISNKLRIAEKNFKASIVEEG